MSVLSEDVALLMSPDKRFVSPGNDWLPQSPDNTASAVAEFGQLIILQSLLSRI